MEFQLAPYLAQSLLGVGVLGCIIGGAAAAAKNIRLVELGSISIEKATTDAGYETGGAGIATLAGAFAAGLVGGGLIPSIIIALSVGIATKYSWDRLVEFYSRKPSKRRVIDDDEFDF